MSPRPRLTDELADIIIPAIQERQAESKKKKKDDERRSEITRLYMQATGQSGPEAEARGNLLGQGIQLPKPEKPKVQPNYTYLIERTGMVPKEEISKLNAALQGLDNENVAFQYIKNIDTESKISPEESLDWYRKNGFISDTEYQAALHGITLNKNLPSSTTEALMSRAGIGKDTDKMTPEMQADFIKKTIYDEKGNLIPLNNLTANQLTDLTVKAGLSDTRLKTIYGFAGKDMSPDVVASYMNSVVKSYLQTISGPLASMASSPDEYFDKAMEAMPAVTAFLEHGKLLPHMQNLVDKIKAKEAEKSHSKEAMRKQIKRQFGSKFTEPEIEIMLQELYK